MQDTTVPDERSKQWPSRRVLWGAAMAICMQRIRPTPPTIEHPLEYIHHKHHCNQVPAPKVLTKYHIYDIHFSRKTAMRRHIKTHPDALERTPNGLEYSISLPEDRFKLWHLPKVSFVITISDEAGPAHVNQANNENGSRSGNAGTPQSDIDVLAAVALATFNSG